MTTAARKSRKKKWTQADYDRAADAYERRLRPEHFMEAPAQGKQRELTLESWAVLRALAQRRRVPVQFFNELLVQYDFRGRHRRVVPDNWLLLREKPFALSRKSYNVEMEGDKPFLVMEYVSQRSKRKDYEQSFRKYERELQVPYCLMYYPEKKELKAYRHDGEKYEPMTSNREGRYALSELSLEAAVVGEWVRFWHEGQLLELPEELLARAEHERQHADRERQRADQERQHADQERQLADQERQRADQERQRADQERRRADAAEAELQRLRALLGKKANEP